MSSTVANHPESSSKEGKTKTIRIPKVRACDFCRNNKIRCDRAANKCTNCSKRGLECTRENPYQKRGPKPKPKPRSSESSQQTHTISSNSPSTEQKQDVSLSSYQSSSIQQDSFITGTCFNDFLGGISLNSIVTPAVSDLTSPTEGNFTDSINEQSLLQSPIDLEFNMYNMLLDDGAPLISSLDQVDTYSNLGLDQTGGFYNYPLTSFDFNYQSNSNTFGSSMDQYTNGTSNPTTFSLCAQPSSYISIMGAGEAKGVQYFIENINPQINVIRVDFLLSQLAFPQSFPNPTIARLIGSMIKISNWHLRIGTYTANNILLQFTLNTDYNSYYTNASSDFNQSCLQSAIQILEDFLIQVGQL